MSFSLFQKSLPFLSSTSQICLLFSASLVFVSVPEACVSAAGTHRFCGMSGGKEKSGEKSREEEREIVWRLVGSGREREIGGKRQG